MKTHAQPDSEEVLIRKMLPALNTDRSDRASAWAEWQSAAGEQALLRYVRAHNSTFETDDDIVQDALLTAYLSVEGGRYQPQSGVPFTAYVVGIARNKIREASRRMRRTVALDDEREEEALAWPAGMPKASSAIRAPEHHLEHREQRDLLYRGIQRLPSTRRQVLERYLAGASTEEIAGQMAISAELVRQHKCRALRAIQRGLQAGEYVGKAA